MRGQAYEKPQTPIIKTVNDSKVWKATLSTALSQKGSISTSSSNSDVAAQNDTKYLNPYHTLQDNREKNSHGHEVVVTVNPGIESCSGSDEETTNHKYSHVYKPLQNKRDTKGHAYKKLQPPKIKTVNVAKLQEANQSRHGTSSLQDCVTNNVDSDKTMNSCDEMERVNHKQDNKKSPHQTKSKTTEKKIFRDDYTENSLVECLNNNVCPHENNNSNQHAYDDATS
ncbi:unnamed protein product [Mytilus coruscus]|uniref:Uncharacterized protein n=1 Tax=Mytilus coruscus TaxID=42192 RepID=A0A6J8ERI1_MYTCO|nr:unnamed protein product [Mytilus coruscus]